ncbi:hypothetical protein SAMCFNEI73_Ch0779 [Sinorhizobium americanum]|uniref:Uncharacterized protein n=1 Tax=Sinorhizobium americanum TaxID=194963 RepID=A0A1L3LJA7_9HYPH|nr:hypothetical protein SAMCCGM7_Ch0781 [Sinorhizobium americanum CCGM7]APG90103.1 hypothetical protein SAMCFNEI73_Ch0779 [Sinorhizobium americanum]
MDCKAKATLRRSGGAQIKGAESLLSTRNRRFPVTGPEASAAAVPFLQVPAPVPGSSAEVAFQPVSCPLALRPALSPLRLWRVGRSRAPSWSSSRKWEYPPHLWSVRPGAKQ